MERWNVYIYCLILRYREMEMIISFIIGLFMGLLLTCVVVSGRGK